MCVCVCVCVTDSLSCTPENNTQIVTLSESESESHSVVSDSLWPHGLYSPWNSPGQNTGVGSFSLLQGIFSTQGSNPGLPHCGRILYQLSHQGSPVSDCHTEWRKTNIVRHSLHVESKKNHTNELIYKTEVESHVENKHGYQWIRWWGINWELGIDICILLHINQVTNTELLYITGNSTPYRVMA